MKLRLTAIPLGLAFVASAQAADTSAPLPVRLGLDTAAGGSYEFRTAQAQGFFAKRGIETTAFNFAFGIDTVNAVLIDRVDTALLARTTINKPADPVGKKLGVARSTVLEFTWSKYLEKNKIDPSTVTFVPYTTPDEAAVGFQRGDIDALWQLGALVEKFLTFPNIKRFADLGDSGSSIDGYLLFQRKFVTAHPEAVSAILQAIREGAAYVKAHPTETGALAFKELKLPAENVARDIANNDYSLGFTKADYDHLADIKAWVQAKGLLKTPYELNDKLVLEPLKKAFPAETVYDPRR